MNNKAADIKCRGLAVGIGCVVSDLSVCELDVVEIHDGTCCALEVVAIAACRSYYKYIRRCDALTLVVERNLNLY